MTTLSSILAWRTPWTEEPGGLQFMGSHRVEHDWSDLALTHACQRKSFCLVKCSFLLIPYSGRWLNTLVILMFSQNHLNLLGPSHRFGRGVVVAGIPPVAHLLNSPASNTVQGKTWWDFQHLFEYCPSSVEISPLCAYDLITDYSTRSDFG